MDKVELNRALAKAIAYKQYGKQAEAQHWALELIRLLRTTGILKTPPKA